uniref:Fibronectin type-II domain-containing protein n=1 Tax=Anolis carolinensis TaxID=28377 RepID=A0A803TJ47_ANOCA
MLLQLYFCTTVVPSSLIIIFYFLHNCNSGGKPCFFPFLYQRRTYYTCTRKYSRGRFWCSTTGNYDINRKWSYCADNSIYPTEPCYFPFMYKNKLYTSCTTAGRTDGKLWCSVNRNYDMRPSAVFCEPSGKQPRSQEESDQITPGCAL